MFSTKVSFFLGSLVAISAAMANNDNQITGGVILLTGDDLKEAEQTLQTSLSKLAAGDGPNYKVSKVISVTRQVVSGTLYKFNVVLIGVNNETKQCSVSIWSQPWLTNGVEVTFDCEGEKQVIKKHTA